MDQFREDSRHGLPPVTGGGESVGGGVRDTDEGRGPVVQVAAEGKGSVQGARGGYGDGVSDGSHEDATWEGGGGETELVSHGPWRGTADIPDGLPDRRRTAELPV